MEEPSVLRETKGMQKGFVKEDVLTYLDELNSKIEGLERDLRAAQEKSPSDPQEIIKLRSQVENLQEKLNASNNALRAANKEMEELKKQLEAAKKGAPAAGGNGEDGCNNYHDRTNYLPVSFHTALLCQGYHDGRCQGVIQNSERELKGSI